MELGSYTVEAQAAAHITQPIQKQMLTTMPQGCELVAM
jgi:hypothetical protein